MGVGQWCTIWIVHTYYCFYWIIPLFEVGVKKNNTVWRICILIYIHRFWWRISDDQKQPFRFFHDIYVRAVHGRVRNPFVYWRLCTERSWLMAVEWWYSAIGKSPVGGAWPKLRRGIRVDTLIDEIAKVHAQCRYSHIRFSSVVLNVDSVDGYSFLGRGFFPSVIETGVRLNMFYHSITFTHNTYHVEWLEYYCARNLTQKSLWIVEILTLGVITV